MKRVLDGLTAANTTVAARHRPDSRMDGDDISGILGQLGARMESAGLVDVGTAEHVASVLIDLGFASPSAEDAEWNLFGKLVALGGLAVIKPHLVRHIHMGGGDASIGTKSLGIIAAGVALAASALGKAARNRALSHHSLEAAPPLWKRTVFGE